MATNQNSFGTQTTLQHGGKSFTYQSITKLAERFPAVTKLPFSLRVLLENLLRNEDGRVVTAADVEALCNWDAAKKPSREIAYHPARVLLQDFTGVPAVVDLAALRDAVKALGGDPQKINPLQPADLVIDHSVQVDHFASPQALGQNTDLEYKRNEERYQFLRWGQSAFENFRVVPPETGIVHQVNLEYLAPLAFQGPNQTLYPDTLVGTDSHTTMINGLGVLGWGVGGIEAEAAMLGQPVSMLIPQVVGFKLTGSMPAGATATDLVLRVVEMLRGLGVVGKFVEFYGPGLDSLPLADRATIANMAPEYGATMGFFPVDQHTLDYLTLTNRNAEDVALAKEYFSANSMFRTQSTDEPVFSASLELDMGEVVPSIAGPKRPQDRIALKEGKGAIAKIVKSLEREPTKRVPVAGADHDLGNADVVIAAITSCTNTSNPAVMVGAGLIAKAAMEKGLTVKPWVKTSLAPGSQVVTSYLKKADLLGSLEGLGFHLVGYGCTTCIGNSGPLPEAISKTIRENDLAVSSVLSGNRNFEGRISPDVRMNFLASPPLVVAYALAGTTHFDFESEPLGNDTSGNPVFLRDIWPDSQTIAKVVGDCIGTEQFAERYASVFEGGDAWRALKVPEGDAYAWNKDSTYVRRPSFLENIPKDPAPLTDIKDAACLALLGDTVTTDHISPAGSIAADSPAGRYLQEHGVSPKDFNSYGSRRGNHEVMMRGTFANVRMRNQLVPGVEGGYTVHHPSNEQMSIYDASMKYQEAGTPLVVLGGKEYGTGSSRDWAAKGTLLLGVRAVIVESFERIHRSNLVGMGVLPLQFKEGDTAASLGLTGKETFSITGISNDMKPGHMVQATAKTTDGKTIRFDLVARLDTPNEVDYFVHGGILPFVLRGLL